MTKPEQKFTADITYGILASGSCLLTDVVGQLHEPSKKINVVDRLSRHLEKGTPASAAASYLQQVKKWVPADPVVHIDDSDVVKPDGYKFESLGIVRDGSESTSTKNVYKKAIMLRKPVSLLPAITRSAYFQEYIHPPKRIIDRLIPSPLMPWTRALPSSGKQPFAWTAVMMITRCS